MTDQHNHTNAEDQAFIDGARRLWDKISEYPAAVPFLVAFGASGLWLLSARVGQVVYSVFDGDGMAAATFGAIFVTVLGAIISVGVWLDRRKRDRDRHNEQADDQTGQ